MKPLLDNRSCLVLRACFCSRLAIRISREKPRLEIGVSLGAPFSLKLRFKLDILPYSQQSLPRFFLHLLGTLIDCYLDVLFFVHIHGKLAGGISCDEQFANRYIADLPSCDICSYIQWCR